jgi:hypothetical protein
MNYQTFQNDNTTVPKEYWTDKCMNISGSIYSAVCILFSIASLVMTLENEEYDCNNDKYMMTLTQWIIINSCHNLFSWIIWVYPFGCVKNSVSKLNMVGFCFFMGYSSIIYYSLFVILILGIVEFNSQHDKCSKIINVFLLVGIINDFILLMAYCVFICNKMLSHNFCRPSDHISCNEQSSSSDIA